MKLSEFSYALPKELIAKYPLKERGKCRLMVLDRKSHAIEHMTFEDVPGYFKPGDCLVLNDTRVIPARLFGKRKTGGKVEIFVLQKREPVCEALLRPSNRLKEGEKVILESGDEAEILERGGIGWRIKFSRPLDDILEEAGHVPLPPYINRPDEDSDKSDYQTIYGINEGATASPTAGLHFTQELLDKAARQGSNVAYVTLHTSYGTFAPIKTDDVEKHRMHKEYFELPQETIESLRMARGSGKKVFAVGTTSNRVLEHCSKEIISKDEAPEMAISGYTGLFIYPGYQFKIVDHLITNFHLPESTLFLLVSAFAGKDFILEAYQKAIEAKYRFYSYGDAMLIL